MDFRALLVALAHAQVEFVTIGGVCAVLHGVPATTFDLDIVHARDAGNLSKLMAVLVEFEACYREHLPKRLVPREGDLASDGHHLLMTRAGPLDLLGTVVGGLGYESLVEESDLLDLGEGQHVRLLRLEALIRLKEQVDRPKDRAQLPLLRRTLLERGDA